MLLTTLGAAAQVNIQEMYDFGRRHPITTVEMYKSDDWGGTYLFTDIYHTADFYPTNSYTEIARSLNFWNNTKMADWSLHAEWNGGLCAVGNNVCGINNAWLFGFEYLMHSADFGRTLTFQVLYKNIRPDKAAVYPDGRVSKVPMQLTLVWNWSDFCTLKGLTFSGYLDYWWENTYFNTSTVMMSEPQLWYNVGQHFGCPHLMLGGEVLVSYNYTGNASGRPGWAVEPRAGLKWDF